MELRTIILRSLYQADIGLFPIKNTGPIRTSDINFELLATFPSKEIELYKGIGKKGIKDIASVLEKRGLISKDDWLSGKTLDSKYYEKVTLIMLVDKLINLAYVNGANTFKLNLQSFRKTIIVSDIAILYKRLMIILVSNITVNLKPSLIKILKNL